MVTKIKSRSIPRKIQRACTLCVLLFNLNTGNISPNYHCVYDDHFTTVNATKYVDKIKLWSVLYKVQPYGRLLVNQLDILKIHLK